MKDKHYRKLYNQQLVILRDFLEPETIEEGFANEYIRGAVELMADTFGIWEMDTDTRKDMILADLRRIPQFADPKQLRRYGVLPYEHNPKPGGPLQRQIDAILGFDGRS